MSKAYETGANKENRVLTVKALVKAAHEQGTEISEYYIRKLVSEKRIPSRRIGKTDFIPEEGFWRFMRCQSSPPEAEGAINEIENWPFGLLKQ